MKINIQRSKLQRGFTLIEMIGVLAVIAILAALLVPKIFEAINNARVNNAAVSYNTVKTALADHYAKNGTMLASNSIAFPLTPESLATTNFDKVMVAEGFMDKPFIVKIGDGTGNRVEIVPAVAANVAVDATDAAFDLDGSGVSLNDATGSLVVWARIENVTENDAKDLNDRIDGPSLGSAIGASDLKGRVKYATGSSTTVYMYLTHR